MVKIHCIEGIANHNVPESCAVTREAGGEALAGVRIGQPLSRENNFLFRTPTRSLTWKATQTEGTGRSRVWPVIASQVRNGKLHCWAAIGTRDHDTSMTLSTSLLFLSWRSYVGSQNQEVAAQATAREK